MNSANKKQNWRLIAWRLRFRTIYESALAFMSKYPPFKYFLYTLSFFKINEIYRKKLKIQREKAPHLTRAVLGEIWDQSAKEYNAEIDARLIKTRRKVTEIREFNYKTKIKLEQLSNFLARKVEREESQIYIGEIKGLFKLDDPQGSYDRLCKFVDSIIEKHANKHSK